MASRSFYSTFQIGPDETQGELLYDLSNGEWDIAALRLLLDRILPTAEVMEDFEVEQSFPRIGRRTMLLNARQVYNEGSGPPTILLAFEDITERRTSERALKKLLEQKDMLLAEMSHRVATPPDYCQHPFAKGAQRTVGRDSHPSRRRPSSRDVGRVCTATLTSLRQGEHVEIGSYLSKLCETLAASMIGDERLISVKVVADEGMTTSSQAVSLGLID